MNSIHLISIIYMCNKTYGAPHQFINLVAVSAKSSVHISRGLKCYCAIPMVKIV